MIYNSARMRALRKIVFTVVLIAPLVLVASGVLATRGATSQPAKQSANDNKSTSATPSASAQAKPAEPPLSGEMLIEPDEVAKAIQSSKAGQPLLIHVGFHILYTQAHIPNSQYLGPASKPEGLAQLRKAMQAVPRNKFIVLYCGCCPWTHCPNVRPAYEALHSMGFTNLKVMHIDDNLGTNWVNKGFPVAKGD